MAAFRRDRTCGGVRGFGNDELSVTFNGLHAGGTLSGVMRRRFP